MPTVNYREVGMRSEGGQGEAMQARRGQKFSNTTKVFAGVVCGALMAADLMEECEILDCSLVLVCRYPRIATRFP